MQEASERKIDLSADALACIDAMITFMYTMDYVTGTIEGLLAMTFHVKMSMLADKYDMKALESVAIEKFKKKVIEEIRTPAEDARARRRGMYSTVYPVVTKEFAAAAEAAYEAFSPGHGMRKAVAESAASYLGDKDRGPKAAFEDLMLTHSELANVVAVCLSGRLRDQLNKFADVMFFKCPGCRKTFASDEPEKYPGGEFRCQSCDITKEGQEWTGWHQCW